MARPRLRKRVACSRPTMAAGLPPRRESDTTDPRIFLQAAQLHRLTAFEHLTESPLMRRVLFPGKYPSTHQRALGVTLQILHIRFHSHRRCTLTRSASRWQSQQQHQHQQHQEIRSRCCPASRTVCGQQSNRYRGCCGALSHRVLAVRTCRETLTCRLVRLLDLASLGLGGPWRRCWAAGGGRWYHGWVGAPAQ